MISRRTALALAEVYERVFYTTYRSSSLGTSPRTHYTVDTDRLYDFMYECNFPAWLCNKGKSTGRHAKSRAHGTRKLREFILRLHTGETQAKATPQWTWKQREQLGQQYLHSLAEDILGKWHNEWKNESENSRLIATSEIAVLLRNLELDGYVYQDSRLHAPESDVLDIAEDRGVLESIYALLGLANEETAFHHLSLSEEHYVNGKWDDSIANSRKFLECVLQEVAAVHSLRAKRSPLPDSTYTRPVRVREYLEREGLLETKEKNVIASVYSLLSKTGGHPYMAQNDQARLLRHQALTLSQFVLLRLQGSLADSAVSQLV